MLGKGNEGHGQNMWHPGPMIGLGTRGDLKGNSYQRARVEVRTQSTKGEREQARVRGGGGGGGCNEVESTVL